MITTVETRKGTEAITSDRWHVVHARYLGENVRLPFRRSISSEHDDRSTCVEAARALLAKLREQAGGVPEAERDQVFVRRPGFKSVKQAKRRTGRTPPTAGGAA
jgi:hypothetical protein